MRREGYIYIWRTSTVGEYDAEGVAESRKGDKHGQSPLSPFAKNISKERRSQNAAGGQDLFFGNSGKICNLGNFVLAG